MGPQQLQDGMLQPLSPDTCLFTYSLYIIIYKTQ